MLLQHKACLSTPYTKTYNNWVLKHTHTHTWTRCISLNSNCCGPRMHVLRFYIAALVVVVLFNTNIYSITETEKSTGLGLGATLFRCFQLKGWGSTDWMVNPYMHSYTYPLIFLPEWATRLPAGYCDKVIRGDHRLVTVITFPRHSVQTVQGSHIYAKEFLCMANGWICSHSWWGLKHSVHICKCVA